MPRRSIQRLAAPQHLTGVLLEHAERDAHGGRLAGAVWSDEPHDLPFGDIEREAVEGDGLPVATGEAPKGEHAAGSAPVYFRRNALMRSA
jgi:hypothetical protein